MSEYVSSEGLFMGVTPGGSFYAVQDDADEFGRQFLRRLLSADETPSFNLDIAQEFRHCTRFKWLERSNRDHGVCAFITGCRLYLRAG